MLIVPLKVLTQVNYSCIINSVYNLSVIAALTIMLKPLPQGCREKQGLHMDTKEKLERGHIQHIIHLDILSQGNGLGGVDEKPF